MSEDIFSPAAGAANGSTNLAAAAAGSNGDSNSNNGGNIPKELPFLVTHWLANYGSSSNLDGSAATTTINPAAATASEEDRQQAVARIRKATSEIASAFATLGAYGTSMRPLLDVSFAQQQSSASVRNSTYSDIHRQHVGLPASHLEHVAHSAAWQSATAVTTARDHAPANWLLQATSGNTSSSSSSTEAAAAARNSCGDENTANNAGGADGIMSPNRGRTLQDAIVLDEQTQSGTSMENNNNQNASTLQLGGGEGTSILQNPTLLLRGKGTTNVNDNSNDAERKNDPLPTLTIQATLWEVGHQTAETMRQLLSLREEYQSSKAAMASLETSLVNKQQTLAELQAQVSQLELDDTLSPEAKDTKKDQLDADQQQCDRVISHLQRSLSDMKKSIAENNSKLAILHVETRSMEEQRRTMSQQYNDPFSSWKAQLAPGSTVGGCKSLQMVLGRQYGLSRSQLSLHRPMRSSSLVKGVSPTHFLAARKNLLLTQLSHAVTINTHLDTPVYSVHFDRTGRYFITGADDYLVKVFCLGAAQSCRTRNERNGSRRLRCNYGANFRGAVLVCSLRGHNGVINDIDVSSDNCFLATTSTDQDVRIWGLKDGSPIAILRGHKNGANMVTWSTLTPFRLVTTASDGFARVWDIREACLKRYGKFVGKRDEYRVALDADKGQSQSDSAEGETASSTNGVVLPPLPQPNEVSSPPGNSAAVGAPLASGPPALPPLPAPGDASDAPVQAEGEIPDNNAPLVEIPAPPLPGAAPDAAANGGSNQNEGGQGEDAEAEPGTFVVNDLIDEGVKIVSKFRHGSSEDAHQSGPGTRSRRAAVNVLCVARCPLGNQFATGSDDGIVRVWRDFDDESVALTDKNHCRSNRSARTVVKPPDSGIENKPLLKLTGHVSSITDLQYSHAGDRILSASQKDGVARIWNIASAIASDGADKTVTQIVIKLKDPLSNQPAQTSRRRPGNSASSSGPKVSCEVAVWTHDDSFVITSQCVLQKQGGDDIKPGSQFIFLWLSGTGQCVMGISGAHTKPCNVVLPHPSDSSIMCTASDDGYAKVWDLSHGKCIFTHYNKVEFGPIEPNDTDAARYLTGSFSPDGTAVVLSDSRGQVSVFDCTSQQENPSNDGNVLAWMREQYFSNDYYELFYDTNGYCIEKGSQQPPHLAPKSRCTHNGSSFPGADDITETFKRIVGPLPLPEEVCRWHREEVRGQIITDDSTKIFASTGIRIAVREFDPRSTLLLKGVGHQDEKEDASKKKSRQSTSSPSTQASANRTMSQRFNYLGYDDLLMREGPDDDGAESEDEEFEPTTAASRGRRLGAIEDDSEEDGDIDDFSHGSYEENHRRRRGRGTAATIVTEERRARANRRAARRRTDMNDFMEIDSDDEATEQYMSSNKTANGTYVRDFERQGHLWKLRQLSDAHKVHREWLLRDESDLSYYGKKFYAPQVGDSVVYIPRAHYETIKEFPTISPPWQDWPTGTAWPVVRCSVQNIRYRFPYDDYFRSGNFTCRSIVAIVTLQVTGVPEQSADQAFPWPKPDFTEPTQSAVFELSVFENVHEDFLIPEFLYTARLKSLERNIRDRGMNFEDLPVDLFYSEENTRKADTELIPWASTVIGVQPEETQSDRHLNDSGFCVLSFAGLDEDMYEDNASPWEINTEGLSLRRPSLTEEEKDFISNELKMLLRKPDISAYFKDEVDTLRYYDYGVMIEVPMDLKTVQLRLNNRYYGSKLSVAADLRLIRDNCIKYNTVENEISKAAIDMCNEFEEKVLTSDERSQLISEEDFEKIREDQSNGRQSSNLRIRLSARTIRMAQQASAAASSSSGGTYSLRDRSAAQRRSSLEELPVPEPNGRNDAASRRGNRREASNASSATRAGRYSLRGQGAGNRTETLARLRAVESREERAARRNRDANNGNADEGDDEGERMSPRSTRRSSRSQRAPQYQDPDSDDEEEEEAPPARTRPERSSRARTSARASRATNGRRLRNSKESDSEANEEEEAEASENEEVSDGTGDDSDEALSDATSEAEDDPPARPIRRGSRGRNGTSSARPSRTTRTAAASSQEDSPGRRSRRNAAQRKTTYRDAEESDIEEYAEESSDADDNEDVGEAPPTSNSRNRQRVRYTEDTSEEEEEEEEESDFENTQRNSNKRKSRGDKAGKAKPAKKTKASTTVDLPELTPWPSIDISAITQVTNEVLGRVAEHDDQDMFATPVIETYPDMSDAYTSMIKEPMDIRTIEEERMHTYTDISQLQDDLILMYRNCCTYNGPDSVLGQYAVERWGELNDIFVDVCKTMNVLLPRRWNS